MCVFQRKLKRTCLGLLFTLLLPGIWTFHINHVNQAIGISKKDPDQASRPPAAGRLLLSSWPRIVGCSSLQLLSSALFSLFADGCTVIWDLYFPGKIWCTTLARQAAGSVAPWYISYETRGGRTAVSASSSLTRNRPLDRFVNEARPKPNICFEVNRRFCTTWCVTL